MRSTQGQDLIDQILSDAWAWDFPATQWEADVVADLADNRVYTIKRFPKEELDRLGMRANACHANVRRIVENNAEAEAAAGWLVEEPDLAVHSVIKIGEHYICVTPSRSGDETCEFMPDPKITWTPYGSEMAPVRNGQIIKGPGIRQYPAFTIARFGITRRRLEAGASLEEAFAFTRQEFEALKRAHLPPRPSPPGTGY